MKFKKIIITTVLIFFQQSIHAEEKSLSCEPIGRINEAHLANTSYVLFQGQIKAIDKQGKLHELPEQDKKIVEIAVKAVHDIRLAECARTGLKRDQNFMHIFFSTSENNIHDPDRLDGEPSIMVRIDLKTFQVVAQWYDSE